MLAKFLKGLAWGAATVALAVVACLVYLNVADLSVHKARIEEAATETLGHDVRIEGGLSVTFGRMSSLGAQDLRITNPEWASQPQLLAVGSLEIDLDLWALLFGRVVVERLHATETDLRVEFDAEGRSNWDSGPGAQDQDHRDGADDPIVLQDVRLNALSIHVGDAGSGAA